MILPLRGTYWLIPILGLLVGGGLSLSGLTAPWLAKAEMACGLDSVDIEIVGVERSYNGQPIESALVVVNKIMDQFSESGGRVIGVYLNEKHRSAPQTINAEWAYWNTDCLAGGMGIPLDAEFLYRNLGIRSGVAGDYIARCRVKRSEYRWDVRRSYATIEQSISIQSAEQRRRAKIAMMDQWDVHEPLEDSSISDTNKVLKIVLTPRANASEITVSQKHFIMLEEPKIDPAQKLCVIRGYQI